jgi:hypothetical protein
MAHGLSKSRLQAFRQCPKRLWLAVHRSDLQEISPETEQRLQIGFQVGDIARTLHPDGIAIDTRNAPRLGDWRSILLRRALPAQPDDRCSRRLFSVTACWSSADLLLAVKRADYRRAGQSKAEYVGQGRASRRLRDSGAGDRRQTGVELAHVDTAFVYPGGATIAGC